MKKIAVIGGGFGGLASAALLARKGFKVDLYEKNDQIGGRARYLELDGYRFDMGPSWYLMPEVFDRFFNFFGKKTQDFYTLQRLDPGYRVFFNTDEYMDLPADLEQVAAVFENIEADGAKNFQRYLEQSSYRYRISMDQFLYRDYRRMSQFFNKTLLLEGSKLQVFKPLDKYVRKFFNDRRSRQLLEYAMVFLGTDPKAAPSMYSLMSHVDLRQGVFYPKEGLAGVAKAIAGLAAESGVNIHTSSPVQKILTQNGKAHGIMVNDQQIDCDAVLINADYSHAELELTENSARSYSGRYWEKRVWAPSMFILFLGLNKRASSLIHHNLYFQPEWEKHFDAIFNTPAWPEKPCFYVSAISKTDDNAAPEGCENLFVLVPVAPGLDDNDQQRERYAREVITHMEHVCGESISSHIDVQRIYSHRDFKSDYNAWQGTALSLSHTLFQTAIFRPALRSKKLKNCYHVGQYTHPGVGVPMVLIAAELAAAAMESELR